MPIYENLWKYVKIYEIYEDICEHLRKLKKVFENDKKYLKTQTIAFSRRSLRENAYKKVFSRECEKHIYIYIYVCIYVYIYKTVSNIAYKVVFDSLIFDLFIT